jgi:N-acetylmuramoyl-L-alanine amidase
MNAQPYAQLSDLDLLSLCVWREARGEGDLGKRGVAWVVRNRVMHPCWWGSSYQTVILKPFQFSSFNPGDPNEAKWPYEADPVWQDCQGVGRAVYDGADTDPTNGAVNYYDISIPAPAWATDGGMEPALETGRLRFFRFVAAA